MDIHTRRCIHHCLWPNSPLSFASRCYGCEVLRPAEREYVARQVAEPGGEKFEWREVRKALVAPHVWILSVLLFFAGAILFGLAL